MKRAWRQRLRLLLLLPFVALFTTGTNFLDCDNSGSTSETPQDESSWFQPEYDFMFGYKTVKGFHRRVGGFRRKQRENNIYISVSFVTSAISVF